MKGEKASDVGYLNDVTNEIGEQTNELVNESGKQTKGVGVERALNNDSFFTKTHGKRLRMATAADNAEILSEMRELIRRELGNLAIDGSFDLKKAAILHKLAQTYAILDCHVDKEHRKYDLTGKTDAELAVLENAALHRLNK